ncbi:hypothetical protein [Elizabethkingia anophelis]|uniref:hypothetical protein n=1 Tax=Elizabethkingia anophelis TaxID=1117645 RepID=UPI0021A7D736|nr:hypothetical protein [Elizabethkingia anophelis]MCT3959292.1 hypothetical protein [Elizabethkingia anophelis]MCT4063341.1 hypothetical protein [Elizabethkingia anophelis]MCT4109633.1 hypothetical protein [Elizabethkingia anophelis]MCT4138305.1 hypothetical protein [Elizabethkingia anophelis]
MRKQIKIIELTGAISEVIRDLYKERGKALLEENNEYYSEIGKNLGLERYTSTDHNITCSKLFAICDFFEISMSDFFKLVEDKNQLLRFNESTKGQLVKKAYKD